MSLKDKGNEEVKKGNLDKAIEYYLQYVKEDHKDNDAAYTNLAQCYFKLKDYRKSIQACENALDENRQFPKAYYRLYMVFRELPDEEFQVFINSYLFLKYYQEDNPAAKNDGLKIMKEFKQKFIKKIVSKERKMEEGIILDLQSLGNQCINGQFEKNQQKDSSFSDWAIIFGDQKITLQDKLEKVKEILLKQNELGQNLAYFLLNSTPKEEDKEYISKNIKKIQKEFQIKKESVQQAKPNEGESEKVKPQQAKSDTKNRDESKRMLVQSQPLQPKNPSLKQSTKIKDTNSFTNNVSKDKKQPIEVKTNQPKITTDNKDITNQLSTKIQPSTVPQSLPIPKQGIQHQFQTFLNSYKLSRDLFKDLFDIICKILRANLAQQAKKSYLQQMQKRCSETSLLKKSLSSKQKKQLLGLLTESKLQSEFDWHEPKSHIST